MKSIGPGPAKWLLPSTVGHTGHDMTRDRAPEYTMGIRPATVLKSLGPGAGKWYIANKTRFGPAFYPAYMGYRLNDPVKMDTTPSPAKYKLPDLIGINRTKVWKDRSPDFVMGYRFNTRHHDSRTPGPKFLLPDPNVNGNKAAIYSM